VERSFKILLHRKVSTESVTGKRSHDLLLARWHGLTPYLLSILRIVAAFLFIQFGTAKWFAFPAAVMPDGGTVPLASLVGVAAVLETVGGLLLLVGLFTRPLAFLLSGQMAFAYFIGHAPQGFWPVLNQGTDAVIFAFLWLYFSAAGPGPWSLDAWRKRSLRPVH
jgi:putative oxidoreductase